MPDMLFPTVVDARNLSKNALARCSVQLVSFISFVTSTSQAIARLRTSRFTDGERLGLHSPSRRSSFLQGVAPTGGGGGKSQEIHCKRLWGRGDVIEGI